MCDLLSSLDTYEQAEEQAQVILDDLEQKLITVYGENDVPSKDNSLLMISGNRYPKVGAEDTAICLTKTVMDGVMLIYGKTEVYVAEETIVAPLTIDSFNFDGL